MPSHRSMEHGIIFDIKRYAIHDGPGIRTTIFFKGCPLNCPWCHNPEGMKPGIELLVSPSRCIECGDCIKVCKPGALSLSNGAISLDRARCTLCMECIKVCHSQALESAGKEWTVRAITEEIEKDALFYHESGGGVTFSGGEPLMQPELLKELLIECKNKGIHTAVDTAGYDTSNVFLGLSGFFDLVLFDLKIMDPEKHKQYTGVPNEPILRNLELLSAQGKDINIRIPLIPGVTDNQQNIAEIGGLLSHLPGIRKVSLLPYHGAWIHKCAKLGREQRDVQWHTPSASSIEKVQEKLSSYALPVEIGSTS